MPIRRIVVALDSSPGSVAALEASAELATILGAEVAGVFVEDVNLLRWSALPFAREVGTTSGITRRPNSTGLRRQLQRQAQEARASLTALAERRGLRTSFRVMRGLVARELVLHLTPEDLLTLAARGRSWPGPPLGSTARTVVRTARGRILLLPAGARAGGPVVVVFDGTPASADALEIARALVKGRPQDLHVYCVAPDERAARAVVEQVDDLLGSTATSAHVRHLGSDRIVRAARAVGANWLIVPRGTGASADERVVALASDFGGCLLVT